MIIHIGVLRAGCKPLVPVLVSAVSFVAFLSILNNIIFNDSVDEHEFSSAQSVRPVFSRKTPLKFSSYRYEAPQDLVLPQWQGREIQTESLIGKVTILFHGKDPTYVRAIQTHLAHNRLHGYPLLALRHAILEGIWSKPAYILAVLLEELRKPDRQRLKWLFWVDADTVITNPKIPLEIFLPPEQFPHLHLLVTADPHGLNNGLFFIKVHPWSVELLSAVIAYPTFRPETGLKFRDQTALEEVLKENPFRKKFAILPQRWINAYQDERDGTRKHPFQIVPGDLLVHFPGIPERDGRMRYYLDIAERHWPKWEIDLDSTHYPEEIKNYWIEQQGVLARERKQAQRLASEAREFTSRFKADFEAFRDQLDSGEVEIAEQNVREMEDALEDGRDDLEIVTKALDNLKKSAIPLRRLVDASKKALHSAAIDVISQTDQVLSQGAQHLNITEEEESKLISLKESLQRLLAEGAHDQSEIRQAINDLGQSNVEARGKGDE